MDVPNLKYIKDINDPPSPKMKRLFMGLTGKRFEPDIRVKGGAGLAIATVVTALQTAELPKSRIGLLILPSACFCSRFSDSTGKALPSSLVDRKYSEGWMVSELGKAAKEFSRVAQATGRKKHMTRILKVRRQSVVSLEAPKLAELTQVKRGFGR